MSAEKYHFFLRILHWFMAICILGLIACGWYMDGLDREAPNKFTFYAWHKSFGVLMILAVVLRIVLRLVTRIPPLPESLPPSEKLLAHGAHLLLYVGMIAVPVSGFVMSMAGGHGVSFFGIKLPEIIAKNESAAGLAHNVHDILPYILLGVIALHIAGALKHRFMDKPEHDVIRRMTF